MPQTCDDPVPGYCSTLRGTTYSLQLLRPWIGSILADERSVSCRAHTGRARARRRDIGIIGRVGGVLCRHDVVMWRAWWSRKNRISDMRDVKTIVAGLFLRCIGVWWKGRPEVWFWLMKRWGCVVGDEDEVMRLEIHSRPRSRFRLRKGWGGQGDMAAKYPWNKPSETYQHKCVRSLIVRRVQDFIILQRVCSLWYTCCRNAQASQWLHTQWLTSRESQGRTAMS